MKLTAEVWYQALNKNKIQHKVADYKYNVIDNHLILQNMLKATPVEANKKECSHGFEDTSDAKNY